METTVFMATTVVMVVMAAKNLSLSPTPHPHHRRFPHNTTCPHRPCSIQPAHTTHSRLTPSLTPHNTPMPCPSLPTITTHAILPHTLLPHYPRLTRLPHLSRVTHGASTRQTSDTKPRSLPLRYTSLLTHTHITQAPPTPPSLTNHHPRLHPTTPGIPDTPSTASSIITLYRVWKLIIFIGSFLWFICILLTHEVTASLVTPAMSIYGRVCFLQTSGTGFCFFRSDAKDRLLLW